MAGSEEISVNNFQALCFPEPEEETKASLQSVGELQSSAVVVSTWKVVPSDLGLERQSVANLVGSDGE